MSVKQDENSGFPQINYSIIYVRSFDVDTLYNNLYRYDLIM